MDGVENEQIMRRRQTNGHPTVHIGTIQEHPCQQTELMISMQFTMEKKKEVVYDSSKTGKGKADIGGWAGVGRGGG